MPSHSTWFDVFLPLESWTTKLRELLGLSFIGHAPVELHYVVGFVFVAILILMLALIARSRIAHVDKALVPDPRLTPGTFFEAMIEGAINTMSEVMDRKAAIYFLPLIGTCAFIIFFSDLIGLVPGFLPPTSNLNTTAAMAAVIFLTTHIYGVKEHGLGYFAHWFGPIRKWYAFPLMIFIFGIEVISHLTRPVSLSIRLMGNMFADHMVVAAFAGIIPILIPLPMMVMGVLVCVVQTAVFCILSAVYIGMAIAHEEH